MPKPRTKRTGPKKLGRPRKPILEGEILVRRGKTSLIVYRKTIKVKIGGRNALAGAVKWAMNNILFFVPAKGKREALPLYAVSKYSGWGPKKETIRYRIRDFLAGKRENIREARANKLQKQLIEIHKRFGI